MLIDDDIENVFPSSYAWWTATERKCWGDGITATCHTRRAGLNCEVSRIPAPEGETLNAQRRVAQVGQCDSLWGAGGVHGLWAEAGRRRGGPHRRPRAPQVYGLRAAGIAVADDKGSGPYPGCGGFERHGDRAAP